MARRVKTLHKNPNERNHRDHRSKKGRQRRRSNWKTDQDYKRRLSKLREPKHEDIDNRR